MISPVIVICIVTLEMVAGALEACKDMIGIPDKWRLSHLARWSQGESRVSRFIQYFTGPDSWRNKYKNRDPEQGPSFPGSTTWLVWITDGWHFCKKAIIVCRNISAGILFSIVYPGTLWQAILIAFIVLYAARSLTFNSVYRLLHLNPINMKPSLQSLFRSGAIQFASFALLIVLGVFIGQVLNPIIDPSYQAETATWDFTRGDFLSVILPVLFGLAYRKFLMWLYRPGKSEVPEKKPSELDYFEENQ